MRYMGCKAKPLAPNWGSRGWFKKRCKGKRISPRYMAESSNGTRKILKKWGAISTPPIPKGGNGRSGKVGVYITLGWG